MKMDTDPPPLLSNFAKRFCIITHVSDVSVVNLNPILLHHPTPLLHPYRQANNKKQLAAAPAKAAAALLAMALYLQLVEDARGHKLRYYY